jgi:hypothetical protein
MKVNPNWYKEKEKAHNWPRSLIPAYSIERQRSNMMWWRYAPEPKTRHRRCFSKTRAMVYQPYVNPPAHIKEIYPLKGSKQSRSWVTINFAEHQCYRTPLSVTEIFLWESWRLKKLRNSEMRPCITPKDSRPPSCVTLEDMSRPNAF